MLHEHQSSDIHTNRQHENTVPIKQQRRLKKGRLSSRDTTPYIAKHCKVMQLPDFNWPSKLVSASAVQIFIFDLVIAQL